MEIGDKIPDILGTDANGKVVRDEDFEGKPLIIYFYPKDNTTGCTAEACSLRDGYAELKRNGFEIVGFDLYAYTNHDPEAHKVRLEMGKKLT